MIALSTLPAFSLGEVYLTGQAKKRIAQNGLDPINFVNRHVHCDWGELSISDRKLNQEALKLGKGIVSAYKIGSKSNLLYVLTKSDRSETKIFLSEDILML